MLRQSKKYNSFYFTDLLWSRQTTLLILGIGELTSVFMNLSYYVCKLKHPADVLMALNNACDHVNTKWVLQSTAYTPHGALYASQKTFLIN